jgi:hypothetical protein
MAWRIVEPILQRDGIAADAPGLLAPLRRAVDAGDRLGRRRALDAAAAALGSDGPAARLLAALAGSDEPAARRIALELAARLPQVAGPLFKRLRPLLRDRQVPSAARLAAALALVRAEPEVGERVLRDLVTGLGVARFLERWPGLRKRLGRKPALERFVRRLRVRLPMRCPRCRVRLPRPAMVRHLWEQHRLMFDGRRARSPWRQIDQWIAEHASSGADDALGRGVALVQDLAPGRGLLRIDRQLLRRGVRDDDSLARLRAEAARRGAGLCPHCFALVPLDPAKFPTADDLQPLNQSHGRLSGHGFVVDVSERSLVPQLWVETPAGLGFVSPEPGRRLTPCGVRWVAVAPLVLLALAAAATLPRGWAWLATPLLLAVALWVAYRWRAPEPDDRPDRAVDHAWRRLVPHLHANGFDPAAGAFIAGLALSSIGQGDPDERERVLRRLVPWTRRAVRDGAARPTDLVPLLRLQIEDAAETDGDPVACLADAVKPYLLSELPLAGAELLLAAGPQSGWSRGRRARLRVLLAARAFEADLGVWDLHALGRACPGLGQALQTDDTDGLARLRLLWDLRQSRPWQRCGPAATVFELANYPMLGGQHFEAAPDLLLFAPLPGGGGTHPLLACGRGLIYRDALVHEWPVALSTRPLPLSKGGGTELRFGPHSIQVLDEATELVRKLEAWSNYFFNEFLARAGDVLARPAGVALDRLIDPLTVRCPECATAFLGRRGEVGATEEQKPKR